MKKLLSILPALLIVVTLCIPHTYAIRSTKVARFDFMCAIEAGDVRAVTQCLEQGLEVNERWGADQDTPLIYAIKKLASETENQEDITGNIGATLYSAAILLAIGCGSWKMKDGAKEFAVSFKAENWSETAKERYKELIAYPVGGITAFSLALFMTSTFMSNSKKVAEYIYGRWKTSTSRLMIIEKIIKHPSIDLSICNSIHHKDGAGQTALDVVQELQRKGHNGYINDLLKIVESLIKEKMRKSA